MNKYHRGEQARYSKLKESEVKIIRSLASREVPVMHIARRFDVCPKTIRDIVQRHTWTHV